MHPVPMLTNSDNDESDRLGGVRFRSRGHHSGEYILINARKDKFKD